MICFVWIVEVLDHHDGGSIWYSEHECNSFEEANKASESLTRRNRICFKCVVLDNKSKPEFNLKDYND